MWPTKGKLQYLYYGCPTKNMVWLTQLYTLGERVHEEHGRVTPPPPPENYTAVGELFLIFWLSLMWDWTRIN
jgi:hypothetical protein